MTTYQATRGEPHEVVCLTFESRQAHWQAQTGVLNRYTCHDVRPFESRKSSSVRYKAWELPPSTFSLYHSKSASPISPSPASHVPEWVICRSQGFQYSLDRGGPLKTNSSVESCTSRPHQATQEYQYQTCNQTLFMTARHVSMPHALPSAIALPICR